MQRFLAGQTAASQPCRLMLGTGNSRGKVGRLAQPRAGIDQNRGCWGHPQNAEVVSSGKTKTYRTARKSVGVVNILRQF